MLFQFDISYVFDTYIKYLLSEIELSKKTTENYAKDLEDKISKRTEALKTMTYKDELTGLYNRRALLDFGTKTLEVCKRRNAPLSVVYFDLNDLKVTNDRHGHQSGDQLLQAFAHILSSAIREEDILFRLGGDEFCILLSDCNEQGSMTIISKITEAARNSEKTIKFSYGVSTTGPEQYNTLDDLISDSDRQMYDHKTLIKQAKKKNITWIEKGKDEPIDSD